MQTLYIIVLQLAYILFPQGPNQMRVSLFKPSNTSFQVLQLDSSALMDTTIPSSIPLS